jgi:N-dimethylarginine dimethylaminohydrolase
MEDGSGIDLTTNPVPEGYHHVLFPAVAEPPFSDPDELEQIWGRPWGSCDEVGRLRIVLVRRPGQELEQISEDAWDSRVNALVAPDRGWYWTGKKAPDLSRVRAQHHGLVAALEAEGVRVVNAEPLGSQFTKALYTRDPLMSVPGGAIIGRLAPLMRRGEEASISRTVAAEGVPILHTIVGKATVEGGSFVKLSRRVAAYGTSIRCNREGAEQLEQVLRWLDIQLITVPLNGFSIHLDGCLGMVDVDKALVRGDSLPHWFLDRLRELGIEPIWAHRDERWAVNSLVVRPGRVLMSDDCRRTAELLERRGVEVVPIPYDEIHHNGGGIHCSTVELLREPAGAAGEQDCRRAEDSKR